MKPISKNKTVVKAKYISEDFPHVSRAVRAQTYLERNPSYIINKFEQGRTFKSKPKLRVASYSEIYEYIEHNELRAPEVCKRLEELREFIARLKPYKYFIDDAVVLCLKTFHKDSSATEMFKFYMVSWFGNNITQEVIDSIILQVQNISKDLLEDTIEYIKTPKPVKKEKIKKWGEEMRIITVGYKNYYNTVSKERTSKLFSMTSQPTSMGNIDIDFSLKYVDESETDKKKKSGKRKCTKHEQTKSIKYGREWIEEKATGLFNYDDYVPMLESVLNLIHSPQSNEEIQNELFDLLGFDKIEFIEEILTHRQELRVCLKSEPREQVQPRILPEEKTKKGKSKPNKKTVQPEEIPACSLPQNLQEVCLRSAEERKVKRKEKKRDATASKGAVKDEKTPQINVQEARERMLEMYSKSAASQFSASLNTGSILKKISYKQAKMQYPHVYDSSLEIKNSAGYILGTKLLLPENAKKRDLEEFEEVIIPKNEPAPLTVGNERVQVADLDEIGRMAFGNIKELNRIQSVVFQTAYNTNENLLICAPTGAGKTNIALLTVVHQIKKHIENNVIMKDKFKIIYIAPMKALASEMTASFSKRLAGLGISVRELTGDMKLTKNEVLRTQMIVTTPEKWDVVTRKGATETSLASIVKLLIIDEVHLLHGDRGPIVEAIVARTLRQVESTQNMIRIVGLSATLPNYLDVARFLRVNPHIGLFYFDSRFRPVPLEQQFIGVKDPGSGGGAHYREMQVMNEVCYDKTLEMVQKGHQVMVFVHARNATHNTAMVLKELAQKKGHLKYFEPESSAGYLKALKSISSSPNKQLAEMFAAGFACHHAGMLRSDRNMVEKFFSEGYIRVLVCTSTLAWGVNLPAHAVIIRGTELYDQNRGQFVDLSILDVLQIFGRAGRPQFDTSGTGIIITTHEKLPHYLKAMTNQFPIESNFISLLADHLNAEIALGTVSNIDEAVEWLSYTYLFVRMKINPQVYGIGYEEVMEDPMLETKRRELITAAAMELDKAQMIRFDDETGELHTTDLGRTASHYYITVETMKVFNKMVRKAMTQGNVLRMITRCSDFQQLKVRKEELSELSILHKKYCHLWIEDEPDDIYFKINVLLQTYLSRGIVEGSSLQSDLHYISQNAVRIVRALLEITLRKNNAYMAAVYLKMAKMLEHQVWDFQNELRQLNCFSAEALKRLDSRNINVERMREYDVSEICNIVRVPKIAQEMKKCADEFPMIEMEAVLQPITRTVMKIRLTITPMFRWNDKFHGKAAEPFWVWVEDPEYDIMYYHEYFLLTKKQVMSNEPQELVITIPIIEPMPPQYYIRATSDRWLGSESVLPLTFHHLILPESHPPNTDLLDLNPLPVRALCNPAYEALYPFTHFNPIQTQMFHCLYHSDKNILLGAATGAGKTIVAEVAMFRAFNNHPNGKVVYIAPLKALVKERLKDWKVRLEGKLGLSVVELTGDVSPDIRDIINSRVIVTTPEKWDGISRSWQNRKYVQDVVLIVIDEIHLLGEDRGPVLEVIVARANFIEAHTTQKVRFVGLSTPVANSSDLAEWLKIDEGGLYNFRNNVRPVALQIHVAGFPGRHYCPRMMTMNKPTFQAIKTHSPNTPALVFVSSRRQTRLTALDLIAYLAAEANPKQWLHMQENEMEQILAHIKDSNLKLTLAFGIGIHHAGLHERDRNTVEELFVNHKIQVLICTATLAWGVNFPARLVVVKGTEYFDGKQKRYVDMPITDVLQMMGRAGRPQFDHYGVAVVLVHEPKKNFYKKFFYEPFPIESNLLEVLPEHLNAEIVAGTVKTKLDILDYLTWTFFYKRLLKNPSYYNLESLDDLNNYLSTLVESALDALVRSNCVEIDEDQRTVYSTFTGSIASYYYLSHKTMAHFSEHLHRGMNMDTLLYVLADCEEFAQLPVRHNEDVLNGELQKECRLPVDSSSLDQSNVKTLLLLQAHLSRLTLPNTDYLTDTKSVLDQTIRIIQAMIDVTAENGWLSVCLSCQMLMQCIIQARWPTDSPLTTLPYVESHHLDKFRKMQEASGLPCYLLNGLKEATQRDYEFLAKYFRSEFEESQICLLHQTICDLPTLNVHLKIRGNNSTNQDIEIRQPPSADDWPQLYADEAYVLLIQLHREGGNPNNVSCPRFPRTKNEGWFVTIGTIDDGELHALKRVPPRGTTEIQFNAPSRTGRVIYTVYIMSDCYMGLDQQYDLQFEIVDRPTDVEIES